MRIKIKILSPVHIGSGEELGSLDYFIDNRVFYRINFDSLFLDPEFLKYSESFIKNSAQARDIREIIKDQKLLIKHSAYSIPVLDGFQPNEESRRYQVKTFVKSAGRVFIPGSSLKGAILSAMAYVFLVKEGRESHFRNNSELLNSVIGMFSRNQKQEQDKKFSRWLDVTDSDLKNPSQVLSLSLARSLSKGARSSIPIVYETIRPGSEFEMEIKTGLPKANFAWGMNEESILKCTSIFYKKVWEKDHQFFEGMKQVQNQIEIREINPQGDNAFLVRLGQGSTAYSTSLLLAAKEKGIPYEIQKPKNHPKGPPSTRKLIGGKPMGWAWIIPLD